MTQQFHTEILKQLMLLICALFFLTILAGCATTFDLTLDGRQPKENRIFGHNVARTLGGGLPEGGTYSGPGVANGKFTPGQVGNGSWEIKYSKFGYSSSYCTIEVYGAPGSITETVCSNCSGKHIEQCPLCKGTGQINDKECKRCEKKGTVPCHKCMEDAAIRDDYTVITDLLAQLSCCRMAHITRYGRIDDFTLNLNLKFGYFDEFNPVMFLYVVETSTGKLKKYALPTNQSEKIEDKADSRWCKDRGAENSPVSFLFKIEEDELIESNIRIIEVVAQYGSYQISLFFDLADIANGDEYLEDDLRVKAFLFNDKYYILPRTVFVNEINDEWETISRDKGWQLEEMEHGWMMQINNKGVKRILDRERKLRVKSGDKITAEEVGVFWKDIKEQLVDPYRFWKRWLIKTPPVTKEIWNQQLIKH